MGFNSGFKGLIQFDSFLNLGNKNVNFKTLEQDMKTLRGGGGYIYTSTLS